MGLGCIEVQGSTFTCIGHEVIRVSPAKTAELSRRLKEIYFAVDTKIKTWQPEAVAAEEVFFANNPQSALKLGQARGAALAAAAVNGLPILEYSATLVKKSITSNGRAEKIQVRKMVELILGRSLTKLANDQLLDSYDALAIALCHAQQQNRSRRLELRV